MVSRLVFRVRMRVRPRFLCFLSKRFLVCVVVLCLLALQMVGAQEHRSAPVTIEVDGQTHLVRADHGTVADALAAQGIQLGEDDECEPAPSTALQPGLTIRVHRITTRTVICREPIRARTRVLPTNRLRPGLTMIQQHPEDGLKELTYAVRLRDGQVVARQLLAVRVVKPVRDKIILVGGRQARLPSRGGYFSGRRLLVMRASAYDPSPRSCGPGATGRTYLGMKAQRGVVAVDPRVIPLGARLYVEGYGEAVAGDIGRAIKGDRIDLCFDTYREALRHGVKRLRVWILSE